MEIFPFVKFTCFLKGGSEQYKPNEEERKIHEQLVNSAWCGLLAALTVLLEACTDEAATENVLKAVQVRLVSESIYICMIFATSFCIFSFFFSYDSFRI